MKNVDRIDISIVLDRSGSMQSVRRETVSSFNQFLADQRSVPGEARLTLVQFDDVLEVVYDAVPLVEVPDLTPQRYQPRGSTALLDAIGQTILQTDQRLANLPAELRPNNVLIVILTDGMENASRHFDYPKLVDLILKRQETGWVFIFLGANQDAIATASQCGIGSRHSMSIKADIAGMASAWQSVSDATSRYRISKGAKSNADFFTEMERAANDPKAKRPTKVRRSDGHGDNAG